MARSSVPAERERSDGGDTGPKAGVPGHGGSGGVDPSDAADGKPPVGHLGQRHRWAALLTMVASAGAAVVCGVTDLPGLV